MNALLKQGRFSARVVTRNLALAAARDLASRNRRSCTAIWRPGTPLEQTFCGATAVVYMTNTYAANADADQERCHGRNAVDAALKACHNALRSCFAIIASRSGSRDVTEGFHVCRRASSILCFPVLRTRAWGPGSTNAWRAERPALGASARTLSQRAR